MTAIAPTSEGTFTPDDWEEVSDNPELTDEQIAQLRPARELPPGLYAALPKREGGRPRAAETKIPITIRLDRETVERFRASGPGWQSRINAILRAAKI